MQGLMMERPLLISALLEHAAAVHGDREVVSYQPEEPVHRGCYRATAERVRRLGNALRTLGVGSGDRVATLACSTHRHLELCYALSGIGAVCHTVNPRLHPDQVAWILNHAEDAVLFVDLAFLSQAQAALGGAERVHQVVLMTDRAHMPDTASGALSVGALCYEELLARELGGLDWPQFEENTAAALCYTSGTTGNPKGVLYSHRSQVLHAFAVALPDVAGLSEADSVLPAAPMFHVNAWGIPYAAALTGARLVLPGPRLHGAALAELFEGEGVTIALGVPTLWVGLIRYLRTTGRRLSTLKRVIVGGAACPRTMIEAFQEEFGIEVRHAWGMTEMSPLGTIGTLEFNSLDHSPTSNTTTSMGRLTLNILLSFAQFEREVIGERIRDKFAASRRKGMWMGGTPPLGYDVVDRKLVVNNKEAELVCLIFKRFLRLGSATELAQELRRAGHTTKSWTTQDGKHRAGNPIDKGAIYKILSNRVYLGDAVHKGTGYPGEHAAIIDRPTWDKVQTILAENTVARSNQSRAQTPALLKGLIFAPGGHAMTPLHSRKNGRLYRYYVSTDAIRQGYSKCAVRSVPAAEVEEAVVAQVRHLLRSPEIIARTWAAARQENELPEREVVKTITDFAPLWGELFPAEQARIVRLLVERVDLAPDGMQVRLRAEGLETLVEELRSREAEAA